MMVKNLVTQNYLRIPIVLLAVIVLPRSQIERKRLQRGFGSGYCWRF